MVTAAALEAHFLNGVDLPVDALSFAADILFRIGEHEPGPRPYEFEDTFFEMGGDRSAARALPLLVLPAADSETSFLYREIQDNPITWWDPLAIQSEVEAWLTPAAGRAFCVDHLIGFLRVLPPEDQVRTGLSWVSKLVLADPAHAAGHSFVLPDWLIDRHTAAVEAGLSESWQEVVDALVVAGVTRLAPYSV